MEHGGFLDTRRSNPVGLGLIIAAHAAVLAAIALSPPDIIKKTPLGPFIVTNIRENPVPPPEPMPQPKVDKPSHVDAVKPVVSSGAIIDPSVAPTVDPGPSAIDAGGAEPVKTPVIIEPIFVQAVIDPRVAARFQPDYPLSLIRAGTEGSATVRILIGSDGAVKQVEMVSATDPAFFEATRKQALRYWRFRAATRDGVPTESWRTMTVRFRIES